MPVQEEQLELFRRLGLKEYPARVIAQLIVLGESKAPEISSASGVPKARVYGILEELADQGLIEVKPGRPAKYRVKPPSEIIRRIIYNKKIQLREEIKRIEILRRDFESLLQPLYRTVARKARKPLIKIVSVGEPSEEETRLMYREAKKEINVLSKSMEWLPKVEDELRRAIKRGARIRILFLDPRLLERRNVAIQREMIKHLRKNIKGVEVRFSKFILPLRGSIVDPSYEYLSGKAIFLVEERGVPLSLRDAALTENPSLVAGMKRYFDLIWKYESFEVAGGELGVSKRRITVEHASKRP
jgi:sugar-specific transcriptional regulator TrmB